VTPSAEDREWFGREVLRALPELQAAAMRFERNRADAEDLVANAVVKAWAAFADLRDRAAFRGWIFKILTRTFINQRRGRRESRDHESLDALENPEQAFSIFERLHQPFLLWWGDPERQFLDRLLREDLEQAVDTLPDVYRYAVTLADLQGLTYQEVADALEVPVGTVRSRLARGRSLLQRALWDHARDAGLVDSPHPDEARTK
jgi:RNA polymerase sigma-70 factor (ECF subfamily)